MRVRRKTMMWRRVMRRMIGMMSRDGHRETTE